MRKKIISALSIAMLTCLFAAGCAVKATESELNALQNFSFENQPHVNEYLAGFEMDEGFAMDGNLSEGVWQNNTTDWTFEHDSSTTSNPITMTTMSYLGEKGAYVAFSVKDTAVYYSADRRASKNTSVEIYVGAMDASEWDENSFRISILPTGNNECITEMYTYRPKNITFTAEETKSGEWGTWSRAHIAGCKINGAGINTSFNEGYDIELFIPYESLGLEEKPEAIQYMTAFYHVESEATDADSVWTKCDPNVGTKALGGWLVATNTQIGYYADMVDILKTTLDSYMTIDGNFDENVWNTSDSYVYQATNTTYGLDAMMTAMTHLSDLGVYLGVQVETNEIYATSAREVKYNSGLELWVQTADQNTVDENSLQIRIDALGNRMKYRGQADTSFEQKYFASRSAVKLIGCAAEDGAIATDTATGYNVELFIPWSELGLTEKAEAVALYPQLVHSGSLEAGGGSEYSYHKKATQATAKTNSKNAFIRMYDTSYLPIEFDGVVSADENYNVSYPFTSAGNTNGLGNTGTVYVKAYEKGAAIAIVMEGDYINYAGKTTGTSTGNNGGGLELMMSNTNDNTNSTTGLWWRVFADGSSRSIRNLTKGAPEQARMWNPYCSNTFYEVKTVAIDEADLSKGYKKMTLEFYMEYESVGATSANDFYLAVGLVENNTAANNNTTRTTQWENSGGASKPSTFDYKTIAQYVTAGAEYANLPVLDGVVDAKYTNHLTYSVSASNADNAEITVYWYKASDAVYLAFSVDSASVRTLTNTGSGNQGSAGLDLVIATKASGTTTPTARTFHRAWASGISRSKQLSSSHTNITPDTYNASLTYMKGSHTVASNATVSDITSYVLEWRIPYAKFGATSADQLCFIFGWMTSGVGDRFYNKATQATETANISMTADTSNDYYWTLADMEAAKVAA